MRAEPAAWVPARAPGAVAPGRRRTLLREIAWVGLLLAGAAAFLWVPRPLGDLRYDSAIYTAQSYALAQGEGNTLAVGGMSLPGFYPPGYPLAIAAVHRVIGFHVQNGVVASHALSVLTLLLLYLLARRVAGPLAGAAAVILLLGNAPFGDMAHRILSQPLTLFACTIVGHLALAPPGAATGPRGGGMRAGILPCGTGFAAGLSVLVHNTNVILAAAVGGFAVLAAWRGRPRRWAPAAWVAGGLAAAGALVMAYLQGHYGSPFLTGYTAWRFPLDRNFSLAYLLHPPYPRNLPPWFLLRSLLGFGGILSLPVEVLWIAGSVVAWRERRQCPQLARLALLAGCGTLLLYGFFGVYYMRSTGYLMLPLPLQITVGACGLVRCLGGSTARGRARTTACDGGGAGGGATHSGADRPRGGKRNEDMSRSPAWAAVGVGLLLLVPAWKRTFWARGERDYHPYPAIGRMALAARAIEPDAVVIGVANPLVVERMLVDGTDRCYLYLPTIAQSEHFRAAARHITGRESLTAASIADWVGDELAAGRSVYLLLHSPVKPEAIRPALAFTRELRGRYRILLGPLAGYLRVAPREG